MTKLLTAKVGLVTGGGMGIGKAICLAYAREGASVVVADFNTDAGLQTVADIRQAGGEAHFVFTDVSEEAPVQQMVADAVAHYGPINIACNSAALSRGSGLTHEYSKEVFDETFAMCTTNTWLCMKALLPVMLDNGGGSIVNISSNASLRGHAYNTAYAAAKGAVNILTKSSAAEYGKRGIRINAVSPGVIRTPGVEKLFIDQPEMEQGLKKSAVMNRLGEPNEIAEAVVFLSSDRASFITGQVLSVDGGGAVK